MTRKSLRTKLLQAAAMGLVAAAANLPGTAAADCSVSGDVGECSGDLPFGVAADAGVIHDLTIHDLTSPIDSSALFPVIGLSGVVESDPLAPTELSLTLDDTVVVNAQTSASSAVTVDTRGYSEITLGVVGNPNTTAADISISSAAAITYDTQLAQTTRAANAGNPGLLMQLSNNLAFGEDVRLALEMETPDAAALQLITDFNCAIIGPFCTGGFIPAELLMPADLSDLVPVVYDYLAYNEAQLAYWGAPPPPEELGHVTAALAAVSTGGDGAALGTQTGGGGDISLTNTGLIETFGANALGIWAQSQGGLLAPIGPGGDIHVVNEGQIVTHGASSVGIFARSLGAIDDGGSVGGHVLIEGSGSITTHGHSAYGVYALSAGGFGFNDVTWRGGNGGLAEVVYGGAIVTHGDNAAGVIALSTGGDGGHGGGSSVSDAANEGGWGGDGGEVYVDVLAGGGITTYGDGASAIIARSRGGVGGEGGDSDWGSGRSPAVGGPGGMGGLVGVVNRGELHTFGDVSYGIFAQSIAGAGGRGGDDGYILVGSGAGGGPAGGGGDINVDNYGAIFTEGRRSYGIYAQSLGGEGGAGGDAIGAFGSSGGGGGSAASELCIFDGRCPDGGAIYITNQEGAVIGTLGYGAHGIFAQSIGGGGGQGGDGSGWINVNGGAGGDAGNGGYVSVTNDAQISTVGVGASGIFQQSIGGGGGAGGDALGVGLFATVVVGGRGGAGGDGGEVWADNSGSILVGNERGNGVFAQSVGGGGGVGGSATAVAFGPGAAASVAIGGDGSVGGDGGYVNVLNSGQIDVHGDFSNGVFAQSVGGGGGAGGSAYSYAFAGGDQFSLAASIALGGGGALGGDGGDVDVVNTGVITTHDFNSFGVFAQSVGGGGGAGGSSMAQSVTGNARKGVEISISVAVGGAGGAGGVGGDVEVTNSGSVHTLGDQSTGIFAQSVGGGGGLGGDASTGTMSLSQGNSTSVEVNVSVGGAGGDGDDGGNVTVRNAAGADIITLGAMSNGITAQSIGGGGGIGGAGDQSSLFESLGLPEAPDIGFEDSSDVDRSRARERYGDLQDEVADIPDSAGSHGRRGRRQSGSEPEPQSFGIGLSIGGAGGAGGDGQTVFVENFGEILTGGVMSTGVFAQSVGGGGGMGGAGRGTAAGDISFGGGVGGSGGSAGDGGAVTVDNFGAITTLQALSYGVMAQSVGGGGGMGGLGAGEHDTPTSFSLSIGGRGGSSGDGGAVAVHQTGDVITFGGGAIGVLAQSVGGGGGIGGSAEESTWGSINLGGEGGSGGDGGAVFVSVDGNIATEGDFAHGVFAQSVGGGGGLGGNIETRTISFGVDPFGLLEVDTGIALSVGNLSVAGDAGGGGDGQTVTIQTTGAISTFGYNAYGIFAQSIGGGGGAGGSASDAPGLSLGFSGSNGADGTAGAIVITHDGDIRTYGENSIGIFAQSMGGANVGYRGGDITITLNGGEIRGGDGEAGAGIMVSGGATNTIINNGGLISAASGIAIAATDGDDHVVNFGRIEGSVGLGGGDNSFFNDAAGVFASGAAVNIGGGPLMNMGELTPFGETSAGETTIGGDYVQGASGVLAVDLIFGGSSDLVNVQGAASLDGRIRPLIEHVADLRENEYVTVLLADSIVNNGIDIDLADTLVVDYDARIAGGELQIGVISIDYVIGGLSAPQQRLAGHLQSIWGAGGSDDIHQLMDYLGALTDGEAYRGALDGIHPFASLTAGGQPVVASQAFLTGLMSCPDGSLRERACAWVRVGERDAEQDERGGDPGYEQDAARYQAGAQFDRGDGWFAGFSLGYEHGSFTLADQARAENESFMLGGVITREIGDWLFAGALDYAHTRHQRTRIVTFPTPQLAQSDSRDNVLAARFRASRLQEYGALYVRPSLDIDGYAIFSGGFTETGAGALNLTMEDQENFVGSATVALELGGRFGSETSVLRPFVQVGVTSYTADSIDLGARFEGAPVTASDFTVSSRLPATLVSGTAGVDWAYAGGSLRVEYEQRAGGGYGDQSFSAKWRVEF